MAIDSVRHLFPQLLRNGWTPLPNRDKACMLPGWPTVAVDEAQCARWARGLRWPAIGLRVEPPMLVLDYDLPDARVVEAVLGQTPSVLWGALQRVGSPPKTAFFLRLREGEEPFREAHTRRYTSVVGRAFCVQAFAGGGGAQQFGAFGPHSHDEQGAVLKTYSWVGGRSPAEVPLWVLPELGRGEVFELLDRADTILAGWPGLEVDDASRAGEGAQQDEYDLTDAMTFVDAEGVEYTLAELRAEAKARAELKQPVLRVTGSFVGDPDSTGSPRAKVYWSKLGGVVIVDFKFGTTHREIGNGDDPEVERRLRGIFIKGFGR